MEGSPTAAANFSENLYLAPVVGLCLLLTALACFAGSPFGLVCRAVLCPDWITTYQGENCLRGSCFLQDPSLLNQMACQNA